MDYCKRIKELREKAHLTQEKLARTMGLETPNFISQIETGRKRVGLSVIMKFCNAMDIEISDFFRENPVLSDVSESIPVFDLTGALLEKFYDKGGHLRDEGLCRIARPADLVDKNAYGAVVSSEDMAPALNDRDVVIASPAQKYVNNDIAIIGLKNNELLLRKIRTTDDLLLLEGFTPAVEPRVVKPGDVMFVHPVLWVRYKMPLSSMPGC
jgi:transcriptional regulator with XRE-family HTH domain